MIFHNVISFLLEDYCYAFSILFILWRNLDNLIYPSSDSTTYGFTFYIILSLYNYKLTLVTTIVWQNIQFLFLPVIKVTKIFILFTNILVEKKIKNLQIFEFFCAKKNQMYRIYKFLLLTQVYNYQLLSSLSLFAYNTLSLVSTRPELDTSPSQLSVGTASKFAIHHLIHFLLPLLLLPQLSQSYRFAGSVRIIPKHVRNIFIQTIL